MVNFANAKYGVEVGCFTGYSALCLAQGIQPGGKMHTIDISGSYLEVAEHFWRKAGVRDRIEFHLKDGIS